MAAAVIAAINQNVARALSRISPNVIFCGRPVMVRRQDRNSGQSTPVRAIEMPSWGEFSVSFLTEQKGCRLGWCSSLLRYP
jgi:hypothetical protein